MESLTASDGVAIRYRQTGSGRPTVLLHGLMAHGGFFFAQQSLADDHRLIAIDFRGHGAARDEGRGVSVERLAQDVEELSRALDLRDALVVGWSLGATVLWHLLTGPVASRFAGGIVIDMTPRVMNGPGWDLGLTRERCDDRLGAMTGDYPAFARLAGQAIFAPDFADGGLIAWAGEEFARNDGSSIASLWTSLAEQDLRPHLGRIGQPVIVVHGEQSHLYGPDTARYLVEQMHNARAVAFAGCGHSPQIEAPDRFNALVRDFEGGLPPLQSNTRIQAGER